MARFVSRWLFFLCCGTIGVGMAGGYCFRGDIPAEPFQITDFVEDAVTTCRSCGIIATRASTFLARDQLDLATFFANSSLNCLSFLNDVRLTDDVWHKGGQLAALFPRLVAQLNDGTDDGEGVVRFPFTNRSVCLTSPSNLTFTSIPILTFTTAKFRETHPLGYILDTTFENDSIRMIFDSLQLDSLFRVDMPFTLGYAFPIVYAGLPDFGAEEPVEFPISALFHNSLVIANCNSSDATQMFARSLPGVFMHFASQRYDMIYADDVAGTAGGTVDCDPKNIGACSSRNNYITCCRVTEHSAYLKPARQCYLDQTIPFLAGPEFLRNSVCAAEETDDDITNETEHCPLPLNICEAAMCCVKTDPVTQRQACVFRVANAGAERADNASFDPTVPVEDTVFEAVVEERAEIAFIILVVVGGAISLLAVFSVVRFDAENRRFHFSLPCYRGKVVARLPRHQEFWEISLREKEELPIVEDLLNLLDAGRKKSTQGGDAKGFRESRQDFFRNVDQCLRSSGGHVDFPNTKASRTDALSMPVDEAPVGFTSGPTGGPFLSHSVYQGMVKADKGIIVGNLCTYTILKLLEGGCQSVCYLVSKKNDHKEVYFVAKVYPSMMTSTQAVSEAYILAQAKHTNILEIVETFAYQGNLVIVTRFCEFGNLGSLVQMSQDHGIIVEESWIMEVFVQICFGLRHLHKMCIIHRDLKPGNIFMDAHGTIKIGDFGLSKMTTTQLADTIVGTPYFMAPEVQQGKAYTFSSDVWSLGVLIYYMCTYEMPFEAESDKELQEKRNAGHYKAMERSSEGLANLVSLMLQKDPTKRPTADELLGSAIMKEHLWRILKGLNIDRV